MNDSIENELKLNSDQKVIKILHTGGAKVIGLGFMKDQVLEKHTTTTPAFLFIHSGAIAFVINGETLILKQGDFYKIPENVEHEIKALESSRLLLIK